MTNDSETSLVFRAVKGDQSAFEELVRRTSRLLFARLYLGTGDAHTAEDLAQETYLTAFRSLKTLKDAQEFRPWLLRIAQNLAVDSARRALRQKRAVQTRALAEAAPSADALANREESRQQVLEVLRSLPEDYRLPLTLRYIGGADYETIGMQLGLSNGSLRGFLHRGLKMLRDRLQDTQNDEGEKDGAGHNREADH